MLYTPQRCEQETNKVLSRAAAGTLQNDRMGYELKMLQQRFSPFRNISRSHHSMPCSHFHGSLKDPSCHNPMQRFTITKAKLENQVQDLWLADCVIDKSR